ncbi:MAG TPA: cation transporter [Polyangiaceae bacterium]|nr:cation transporter [Polyangiaceae bacterium]
MKNMLFACIHNAGRSQMAAAWFNALANPEHAGYLGRHRVVAITAALGAGSVALLGFGIDSFVECSSALVMTWRLLSEVQHRSTDVVLDAIEHRARRLIALSLFALAMYVIWDAGHTLWKQERPEFSLVGCVVLSISIGAMLWLARAKRAVARSLKSEAMEADAFQTTACWWLSLAALAGIGLNGAFGWWWADPLAAIVIAGLVAREGRQTWQGKACC